MVARSLGMNRLRSFLRGDAAADQGERVAGAIFAFISAIDETIVACSFRRPVSDADQAMFTALRDEIDPTIAAISTLMTAASFMLVLVATSRSKKERVSGRSGGGT